ncbi:hypothetical protein [Marinobacterium litorale]|uniref:hypothetical protein n=1 Tax=Marinobacterium litorale TaxID=404770 RepID=UPI00048853A6|nr:hypothetical protein [Marinobacterium litorale]
MSRLFDAKKYAYAIRHEGHPPEFLIAMTIERFGLSDKEAKAFRQYAFQRVIVKCDATLCGRASLLAARVPLNRIGEVFAA